MELRLKHQIVGKDTRKECLEINRGCQAFREYILSDGNIGNKSFEDFVLTKYEEYLESMISSSIAIKDYLDPEFTCESMDVVTDLVEKAAEIISRVLHSSIR
jgi:hypothetical protein